MGYASGLIGILSMLALAYVFSVDRRAIKLDTIAWGVGLQFLFAVVVLRVPLGQDVVQMLGDGITWVLNFSFEGSKLVFGNLGKLPVHPPEDLYFAFQVLPNIIFASALIAIFRYYGLIRALIRVIAKLMVRTFHASGAESLNVAATIFIGQTEAPLTIRSYLPDLTRSEVMTVMTSGMAHVSGGILAAYIIFGIEAKHLLSGEPTCGRQLGGWIDEPRYDHRGAQRHFAMRRHTALRQNPIEPDLAQCAKSRCHMTVR